MEGGGGTPPPLPPLSNLLHIHHVVSSLQTKKRKKRELESVEGRRHPSAGSRRIAERGKGRDLEREREENISPDLIPP